jgi:hypothetical protein
LKNVWEFSITKLQIYPITKLKKNPSREKDGGSDIRESRHEGSGIGKEDLRQVQDRAPQGRGACDLRKLEAQAKTRMICDF